MIENVEGFEWDAGNIDKCERHGVSISLIENVFVREVHILGDILHSNEEERFVAIGKTLDGRGVFVGFTFRPGKTSRLIRPITARFMHEREVKKYEKAIAEAKK